MNCNNCWKCLESKTAMNIPATATRMILCSECGNKRCPKANDHKNKCTKSNAVGQKGSAYEKQGFLSANPANVPTIRQNEITVGRID